MKKYFKNVISILLIAITVSSLSACASKTAASQTAPEGAIAVASPEGDVSFPDIDLRDYSQKSNLENLFEDYTEDYDYVFREAKKNDRDKSFIYYTLPLRQSMSLNGGDVLILFQDEDWKAMQETKVDISVDILIIVQSSKRYVNKKIKACVTDQQEKSYFIFSISRKTTEVDGWNLWLGRK